MKIVILDANMVNPGDLNWDKLKEFGELIVYEDTPYEDEIVQDRIFDADIVFTNKVIISKETIFNSPKLKFIGVLATGYNVVDIEAAKEKGITVTNIPEYGTTAVSQYAIALLLEICHNIGYHNKLIHEGNWSKKGNWCFWERPLIELHGKTMGIVGYGKIGEATANIARALGMKIISYSPSKNSKQSSEECEFVKFDELLKRADVISLHCPLTNENMGMINKKSIDKMKDGVILINVSRGGLVVDEDLAKALKSGKVYAAGLDVVSKEPIEDDNPLLGLENCFITPHIAWAPKESRSRIIDMTYDNLKSYLDKKPKNVIV